MKILTWPNHPILRQDYDAIAAWVTNQHDFTIGDDDKLQKFIKKQHLSLTLAQAQSIRRAINVNKIQSRARQVRKQTHQIVRDYERGIDILALSAKYDYPPLPILYNILALIYNNKELRDHFMGRDAILRGRDDKQYRAAYRVDATNPEYQRQNTERAAHNEAKFVKYCRTLFALQTEDQLKQSQISNFGQAVATPDVLAQEPLTINGHQVKWIDFKDYAGTPSHLLYSKNCEQAAKYHALWGPGAICYRHSYVEGLTIPGAILLDGSGLPIDYE